MRGKSWSKQEEDYLREHYPRVMEIQEIADALGRSKTSVKARAVVLGVTRHRSSIIWPPERDERLRQLYPNHTNIEVARMMGTTEKSIQHRAFILRLFKDPEWAREKASKGWFKKGRTPENKGKKWDEFMSKEAQERSRSTTFKKGHVPPNHKPVGWERKTKDGYWEVKVAEPRTFKAKHRLLWEEHHGPIPKGVQIVFIDGNPDNIVIENLRAETLREKFDRCCSIHTTLPPELRELVQLKGALHRQLNKLEGRKQKRVKSIKVSTEKTRSKKK